MITNTEGTAESIILMEDNAHQAWKRLKEQYEGKTRTNLTALLSGVFKLQFDNRTSTIDDHINEFQIRWGRLASTVAGETDTLKAAGAYAVLTKCDSAKAQILLGTLPDYYKMVVNNIASQSENPSYQSVTVQLRDLITKGTKAPNLKTQETAAPPTAFAGQSKAEPICNYCKKVKGWSGRGHLEADCRTKKRDLESKHQANLANTGTKEECTDWAFMGTTPTGTPSTTYYHYSADWNGAPWQGKTLPVQVASALATPRKHPDLNAWQYDSACSIHLTPHFNLLQNPVPYRTEVQDISGGSQWSTHKGSVTINQPGGRTVTFHNVLRMPNAPENLLSGQVLLSQEVYPILHEGNPRLVYKGKTVLTMTITNNKQMIYGTKEPGEWALTATGTNLDSVEAWHERYGHLPLPAFKHVAEAPPSLCNAQLHCAACQKGKSIKAPSPATGHRADRLLDTVHSDLCGPMETKGINGQRYICTLIDDHSRMTMLRAISSKSEAPHAVLDMINTLET